MGRGFSDYVPEENLSDELSAVYGARGSQNMYATVESARRRYATLSVLSDQFNAPPPGQGIVDQLKQRASQLGDSFLNADFAKSNLFNLASQGASGLASMLPDTTPTPTKYGDVEQSPLVTAPINAARGVLTGASTYLGGIGQAQQTMGTGDILQDPIGTGMNIVGGAASGFASAIPSNALFDVASEAAKATLPESAQQPLATLPVVGDVTLPGMIGLGASLKAPLSGGEQLAGDLTGKALSKGLGVVRNVTRGLFDKASLSLPGAGTLARDNESLVASMSTQLEDAIAQTNTSLETLRQVPVSSGRVPLRQIQETESVETGLVLTKSLIDAGFHPSDVSNLLDAAVFNSSGSQFARGAGAWEPLASNPELKALRDSLAKVSELPKPDLTPSNSTVFLHGSPNPYDTVSPSSLNPFDRDGIGLYLTDAREAAQRYAGNSGQIRQVRVPNTFDILDLNNLTSQDFDAIASALNTMRRNGLSSLERVLTGTDLEQGFKASKFDDPNDPGALVRYINNLLPTSSRVATDAISPSMQQPNLATGVLALAGYDGLRFMHPAGDMAGEAYRALSIFPTSLNMIQNAETKQWMGASLGGLADRFLPNAPGAERAAGAAVGGVTGFMNPGGLSQGLPGTQDQGVDAGTPQDQGSNAGTPQDPTLGQRIAGGVTGAVIGSQVPGALRKALGRERGQSLRLPGAGIVEPPSQVGRSILSEQRASQGKLTPANTNKELDALTLNAGTRVNRLFFDRLEPLRNVAKAAEGRGYAGESAYERARLLPGSHIATTQFVEDNIAPALNGLSKDQFTVPVMVNGVTTQVTNTEYGLLNEYMGAVDALERTMTLGKVELDKVTARAAAQGRVPTAAEIAAVQKLVDDRIAGSTFDVTTVQSTPFGSGTSTVTNLAPIKPAPMRDIEDDLFNHTVNDAQFDRIQDAAKKLADANDKLRLQQLEAGLWSQEEYDFYKANMPNYVRYDVEDYLTSKGGSVEAQSTDLSVQDRFLDKMSKEGTALNRQEPVASLVNQSAGVMNRVERNKIAQTIEEYRESLPELKSALREVQPATTPGSPAPVRAVKNPSDEEFTVWRDGKPVKYYVDKAYTNLWNIPSSTLGVGLQMLSKILGVDALKAGATTLNLGWLPMNFMRDAYITLLRNSGPGRAGFFKTAQELGTAYADLLGRKQLAGAGIGAAAGAADPNPLGSSAPNLGERIGGAVVGAVAGGNAPRIINAGMKFAGRAVPPAARVADAERLARLGVGAENVFSGYSPEQVVARIRGDSRLRSTISEVKDQVKLQEWINAINQALKVPGAALNDFMEMTGLSGLSAKVEAAPRLAQFRLSRAAGKSDISSALDARNVTMDFDRAGVVSRVINQMIPFFNVAVQGGDNVIRRDFAKGNRTATATAFTVGVVMPKLVSEAWNRSQFPNEYAEVPDYIKDSSIVIMLGRGPNEANGNPGQPQFIRIPLPQEVQGIASFITTATDKMVTGTWAPEEGKTVPRGWGSVLESFVGSLSPLQSTINVSNLTSLLPPLAKGAVEVSNNLDTYRNLSIVPDPLHALPPEEQTRPWTTAVGKALGRVFGTSPAYVEHLITSVSGGTGQQLLDVGDTLSRATGIGSPATSPQRKPTGVAGLDSLVGAFYRQQGGQDVQALRDKARNDIKIFGRQAVAYLEALPSFQSSDQATQDDQRRKVANAVEQLIIDVQRAGVFTSAKTTPNAKYLMSDSPAQDLIFDKAVQKVRAYEEARKKLPPSAWPPEPSIDDRINYSFAVNRSTNEPNLSSGYKIEDKYNKQDVESTLNTIREKVYNR